MPTATGPRDDPTDAFLEFVASFARCRGCSQADLRSTGGDGLLYCFAVN